MLHFHNCYFISDGLSNGDIADDDMNRHQYWNREDSPGLQGNAMYHHNYGTYNYGKKY